MPRAIDKLQHAIEVVGAPYFGTSYSWEVLSRLGVSAPKSWDSWPQTARRRCFETLGCWQIPSMDSILAFASWEVWNPEDSSIPTLREPGRVFISDWSNGISD